MKKFLDPARNLEKFVEVIAGFGVRRDSVRLAVCLLTSRGCLIPPQLLAEPMVSVPKQGPGQG